MQNYLGKLKDYFLRQEEKENISQTEADSMNLTQIKDFFGQGLSAEPVQGGVY